MSDPQRPSERTAGQRVADQELGYEQARDELLDVVRALEAGGATLEESLALWERGERLAEICQAWLDGARQRLDAARAGRTEPGSESVGRREPDSQPAAET